jgi:hypothetical protein
LELVRFFIDRPSSLVSSFVCGKRAGSVGSHHPAASIFYAGIADLDLTTESLHTGSLPILCRVGQRNHAKLISPRVSDVGNNGSNLSIGKLLSDWRHLAPSD